MYNTTKSRIILELMSAITDLAAELLDCGRRERTFLHYNCLASFVAGQLLLLLWLDHDLFLALDSLVYAVLRSETAREIDTVAA